ncbi:MAG TPA: hypothetical protein VF909_16235, partial [Roseiflexaceae bacterium]
IRRRRRWFVFYLLASFLFYTPFKNLIAMVAQIKEALGERQWKVTPAATSVRMQVSRQKQPFGRGTP